MESDWRWNVWLTGLAYAGVRLCARYNLPGGSNYYVLAFDFTDSFYGVGYSPTPYGYISGWTTFPIPADHPHFPYGQDVLPDHT